MTLNKALTLDEYFHQIVKQPPKKEATMFDKTKMFFNEQLEKINSLLTKPTAFEDTVKDAKQSSEDGYWTFGMYTPEYLCDDEVVLEQSDTIFDLNDSTWMDTLDQILDVMGKHYGYNIKDQVYYAVQFPNNTLDYSLDGKPPAGYERMLNDEILQQLLLAFPEVYESRPWSSNPTEKVMFK